ncbi:MAG: hypothetical protein M3Q28_03730 [Pseudomonadota bacterium]|nr:hypothetical protein [Pseudomonadota bacterium]
MFNLSINLSHFVEMPAQCVLGTVRHPRLKRNADEEDGVYSNPFYLLQSEFFVDSGRGRHVAWHLKIALRPAAHFFDDGIKPLRSL